MPVGRGLVGALALLLFAAAPAFAGTAAVEGTMLRIVDSPGSDNYVTLRAAPNAVEIQSDGGSLTPGPGCQQRPEPTLMLCDATGVVAMAVELDDGDDRVRLVEPLALPAAVNGGPGDDQIELGAGADTVDGGAGFDLISTEGGADTITTGPGPDDVRAGGGDDSVDSNDGERDDIACGGGNDSARFDTTMEGATLPADSLTGCEQLTRIYGDGSSAGVLQRHSDGVVVYATFPGRTSDLSVRLDGDRVEASDPGGIFPAGQCTRPDPQDATVVSCPMRRWGGARLHEGDDSIVLSGEFRGKGLAPFVFAGGGDDTVRAGTVPLRLEAGAGNDRLFGSPGNDEIDGGPGNDVLRGGAGVDFMVGRTGNDVLVGGAGIDRFDSRQGGTDADAGRDSIDARDGLREVFVCYPNDRAAIDVMDATLKRRGGTLVYRPCRGARVGDTKPRARAGAVRVGSGPLRAATFGRTKLAIRCPRAARGGCAGYFRLRYPEAGRFDELNAFQNDRMTVDSFRLRAGQRGTVRFTAFPHARTYRAGHRERLRAPAFLITRDAQGRTRTVKLGRLVVIFG